MRSIRRATPPHPDASWAFFLDVDGTLVAIAESPGAVRIDRALHELVETLTRTSGGALALVTGRSIADIDALFAGGLLPVAGQHGLERRRASGRISRHRTSVRHLAMVRGALAVAVGRHPLLLLEDKGLSLALHYRRAPRLAGYAHRLARALLLQLGPDWTMQRGKQAIELRPAGPDKGTAIEAFMHEPPFRGRTPLFIGDDVTDEHGFAMVATLGGEAVKVGPGPTCAAWRLDDVTAVRSWLERGRPVPRASR
jgi:trehalose 6-phosphate phosphatase